MDIAGIRNTYRRSASENRQDKVRGTGFSEYLSSKIRKGRDLGDAYAASAGREVVYCETYRKRGVSARRVPECLRAVDFPIETNRYKIEDAGDMEGVPAYYIQDMQGGGLYIRQDELAIQRDGGTGKEFIINMDQPLCSHIRVTDELRKILDGLSEKRGFDIPEIPMQGGLVINIDPKTGLQYMTIKGNEGKGAHVLIESQQDKAALEKIVDEFMQYSTVVRERNIAGLWAVLEVSGNLKRGKEGFTYLTPNGVTYIPYDGDPKKAWEIDMSQWYYADARKALASGMDIEDSAGWMNSLKESKVPGGALRLWDSFGEDRVGGGKSEEGNSRTDIIVKPDGSRVLVVTMNFGGMEMTMSLKISDPTDMQNDNHFPNDGARQGQTVAYTVGGETAEQ